MFFDTLIIFLIWFILLVLLISIIFYNRLRLRDYYFSNETNGDALTFTQNGDYYKTAVGANNIVFQPLYGDRNRDISGGLVVLTYSTASTEEYYRIRVMDGTTQLSEGVYRIDPKLCYNNINFSAKKGDNRQISFEIQKYNRKTQEVVSGAPSGINLVKAFSYYY